MLADAVQAQQERLCKKAVETHRCLICLERPRALYAERSMYSGELLIGLIITTQSNSKDGLLASHWCACVFALQAALQERPASSYLGTFGFCEDDDDALNPDARAPSSRHHADYDEESGLRIDSGGVPAPATPAQRAERLKRARVAARLSRARAKKGEATGADGAAIKQYIDLRWEEERGSGAPRAAWAAKQKGRDDAKRRAGTLRYGAGRADRVGIQ